MTSGPSWSPPTEVESWNIARAPLARRPADQRCLPAKIAAGRRDPFRGEEVAVDGGAPAGEPGEVSHVRHRVAAPPAVEGLPSPWCIGRRGRRRWDGGHDEDRRQGNPARGEARRAILPSLRVRGKWNRPGAVSRWAVLVQIRSESGIRRSLRHV